MGGGAGLNAKRPLASRRAQFQLWIFSIPSDAVRQKKRVSRLMIAFFSTLIKQAEYKRLQEPHPAGRGLHRALPVSTRHAPPPCGVMRQQKAARFPGGAIPTVDFLHTIGAWSSRNRCQELKVRPTRIRSYRQGLSPWTAGFSRTARVVVTFVAAVVTNCLPDHLCHPG